MSRTSQESSTAFGEVLRPASQNYSHNPQGRIVSNDNRLCPEDIVNFYF